MDLQIKMSLQLYQVDHKNYLLDFKSLDTQDHPDAARVKRMTKASMHSSMSSEDVNGWLILRPQSLSCHCQVLDFMVGSVIHLLHILMEKLMLLCIHFRPGESQSWISYGGRNSQSESSDPRVFRNVLRPHLHTGEKLISRSHSNSYLAASVVVAIMSLKSYSCN